MEDGNAVPFQTFAEAENAGSDAFIGEATVRCNFEFTANA